jgi:outer membrane protein TolC
MMKKKIIFQLLLLPFMFSGIAQEQMSFSLQEAIDYGLQHNFEILSTKIDIKIAQQKVVETRAIGLPHLNASAAYDYFVNIPTQLMPDFIGPAMIEVNQKVFGLQPLVPVSGEPRMLEMKFGQTHNISAGITATQLLFNGSYLVGLQASKSYVNLSKVILDKKAQELKHSIAKAYYPVIIIQENLKLMDTTLLSLRQLADETSALFAEGFVEDTDVEQIKIMINDVENTKKHLEMTQNIAIKNLKFQMGLPLDIRITLSENINNLLEIAVKMKLDDDLFSVGKHKDFQLLQAKKALSVLDLKNKRAALLPVLSAYYNYQKKAMRDDFNFFEEEGSWFPTQVAGIKLNIPIFQSWQSRAIIQQKKLELKKLKIQEQQLEAALNLQYQSTRSNLQYTLDAFYNKKLKMSYAQKVYDKTKTKYKTGLSSSLRLTQAFNQYLQAEMEYLNAMTELLNSKEDMEMQLGN